VLVTSRRFRQTTLALALVFSGCAAGENVETERHSAELVLTTHLAAMTGAGPEAATRYRASLERLRANGPAVLEVAAAMYKTVRPGDFDRRWSLLQLAGETQAAGAHEMLFEAAVAPLPPAPPATATPAGVEDSPTQNELVVRHAAVRSLRDIAGGGNTAAQTALEQLVGRAPLQVRREAAIALAQLGGGEATAERIRQMLPQSEWWVLGVKRRMAPQPFPAPDSLGGNTQPIKRQASAPPTKP
jgi:hypothetical protein